MKKKKPKKKPKQQKLQQQLVNNFYFPAEHVYTSTGK